MIRVQNRTVDEHCVFCCRIGKGLIVATYRDDQIFERRLVRDPDTGVVRMQNTDTGRTFRTEELGPCPMCEEGQQIEFPEGKTGPWGTEGFWRGRLVDTQEYLRTRPNCDCKITPVPRKDVLDALRAEVQRLGDAMDARVKERHSDERARAAASTRLLERELKRDRPAAEKSPEPTQLKAPKPPPDSLL